MLGGQSNWVFNSLFKVMLVKLLYQFSIVDIFRTYYTFGKPANTITIFDSAGMLISEEPFLFGNISDQISNSKYQV